MKTITGFLFIIMVFACNQNKPLETDLQGKEMPQYNILTPDSTYYNTREIAKGKRSVLFFLSPVCPYCLAQLDNIINKIDKLKDFQFCLLTSVSYKEMVAFYKQHNLEKYSNIKIGIDENRLFRDYFEVPGVPYTVIYDKNKKLQKVFLGKIYASQLVVTGN